MQMNDIDPRRYPLAYSLRAARLRQEHEIGKPLQNIINRLVSKNSELLRHVHRLTQIIKAPIIEGLIDTVFRSFTKRLIEEVKIAVARATGQHPADDWVTVDLPKNLFVWNDDKSVERMVMDQWLSHRAPDMRVLALNADLEPDDIPPVVVLDIYIPALAYRHSLMECSMRPYSEGEGPVVRVKGGGQ